MRTTVCLFLLQHLSLVSFQKTLKEEPDHCACGKFVRNRTNTLLLDNHHYDTLISLSGGSDSNVEHAYSPVLQRCVAVKHCSEQNWLNKCTRELEILKALNGTKNDNTVQLYDFKIRRAQKCMESSMFSDYLRMIVVGSDRRRRRRQSWDLNKELDNCTEVTTVMELGKESAGALWRRLNRRHESEENVQLLEQLRQQVKNELDFLHQKGLAHRDVHPDNVLLMSAPNQTDAADGITHNLHVKLIDFGWTCCFDAEKCGLELSALLPKCSAEEGLTDDKFGWQDLVQELQKL